MTTKFYLARPECKTETAIFARICYAGQKVKYYIPEKIHPKFWSETKRNQAGKPPKKYRVIDTKEAPEFNQRLDSIKTDIGNIFRTYVNNNEGTPPAPEKLKELLDEKIKKVVKYSDKNKSFFGLFEAIIEETKKGIRLNPKTKTPISKVTLKGYVATFKHLQTYQKTQRKVIDFDTINHDFYNGFIDFLMRGKVRNNKSKKTETLNLATNTIGKHIQVIKMVMNDANDKKITSNTSHKTRTFSAPSEESTSIYLNRNELKQLENLDLSENTELEIVRDLFLVGAHTGLRYSDYSNVLPENIDGEFIRIKQSKTKHYLTIDIDNTVRKILDKYGNVLPESPNNQRTNECLAEIGKMIPALDSDIRTEITKGGVVVMKTVKKYQLLKTHSGRRSFASNEYLDGVPAITIMATTGHKSEKSFLKYIKLSSDDHAVVRRQHREKRSKLAVA